MVLFNLREKTGLLGRSSFFHLTTLRTKKPVPQQVLIVVCSSVSFWGALFWVVPGVLRGTPGGPLGDPRGCFLKIRVVQDRSRSHTSDWEASSLDRIPESGPGAVALTELDVLKETHHRK